MDHTIERVRCSSMISAAVGCLNEAAQRAREAHVLDVVSELENVVDELVYAHRQILELPPQVTPAACEFERCRQFEDGAA